MTTHNTHREATTADSGTTDRRTNGALWGLQVLTAVAAVGAGLATVGGAAQPVAMFEEIGAGEWFRYLTGTLEIAGGIGLVVPRLCGLAGLALAALWVGAIATHLFVIGGSPAPAIVFLVITALIAYARRGRTADLLRGVTR